MKTTALALPGVLLIEPEVFSDARGFFFESFNQDRFDAALGRCVTFVQDNHCHSARHVLRGLHYQIRHPQGKLIRVVHGEVFDVVVDIRKSSASFGQWAGQILSSETKQMLWVPEGFAHGFLVRSEQAEVLYKTTDYWSPEHERCIAWNDPDLAIDWPISETPVLSAKDQVGKLLHAAALFD